jgi:hypothetical protein
MAYAPIDDQIGPVSPTILARADSALEEWKSLQRALGLARVETLIEGERWRAAIETGMVEHLYAFGPGVTEQIVQYGLASEEGHALDSPTYKQIEGQRNAYNVLLERIRSKESITSFFVCELHDTVTAGQDTYEVRDQFGHTFSRQLSRGAYKQEDNHVLRPDGTTYFYCPSLLVASEMDTFVRLLSKHSEWHPVVLAAFAHHRFTRIHPFEDGNGRVARLLCDYYLVSNGFLPFIVDRSLRDSYLRSLREADDGVLAAFVDFIVEAQAREVTTVEKRGFSPDLVTSVSAPSIARALATVMASRKKSPSSERLVREEILTPILLAARPEIERGLDDIAAQFHASKVEFTWELEGTRWEKVTPDSEVSEGNYNVPSLPVREILSREGLKWMVGTEVGYLCYHIRTEGVLREYRLRAIMTVSRTGYEKVALLARGVGVDSYRPKIVDSRPEDISWNPWLDESLGRMVVSLGQA